MSTKEESPPGSAGNSVLNDEQVFNLGALATDAFNNPLFQIWHDMMMARTIQAIDAAAPDHTKAVMWAKTQRSVLFEMGRDFNAMIQHSERRYAELQHENSAAAKQEAKLDTQGFGLDFQARGQ